MQAAPRTVLLALVAISGILSAAPLRAQDAVLAQPVLTLEQMEDFLLNAKILKTREINKGITGSQRATMSERRGHARRANPDRGHLAVRLYAATRPHRTEFQG